LFEDDAAIGTRDPAVLVVIGEKNGACRSCGRFGLTPNPFGFGYRDLGLGTFLRSGFGAAPNPNSQ
jgi:hypothetical protein